MSTLLYNFYNDMTSNDLVMIYEGEFSQEVTKSVLNMAERNFETEGIDTKVKKKIYNVMVETLQNICKHQQQNKDDDNAIKPAIFIIGFKDEQYLIITGNGIDNDKIEGLKNKIDFVNTHDKEGLKKLYKEARLSSTISEVGGAGLGFIDIARKSGNKIHYLFEEINDKTSFVTIEVLININDSEE